MPHLQGGALKRGQFQRVDLGALASTWARARLLLPLLSSGDLLRWRLILILSSLDIRLSYSISGLPSSPSCSSPPSFPRQAQ
ncbi:uncharacterized protein LACBIDRAFT_312843 [Laccaria bicolor S238N-H82]|uniref:Predicted protein n=1 Tax=Laccaria bicolor (strain S238N-H82 / ATCC MYA-4686) TaxID=486041 RepID=B0DWX8_LACBS|nr:uncharacterized protein LACBIDRAFT_312843 [Laccaria bicolor S238N-H82]EDR00889.1 predicted protein [Laccaria bicolor S238N-H82]|eukprot:XP_001888483.1 predicted protein [Laccaria bicolor S238N-H82]